MKLRRILSLLISFLFFPFLNIYAQELETEAPAAILMDQHTGKVLFEKNSHEVRHAASLMKIMNLVLAMEELNEKEVPKEEKINISDHAAETPGADVWLKSGEAVSLDDLIKAIAMVSANDASVALGEYVSGSEGEFVAALNNKAQKLKMENTIFKDCIGTDEDGNVTTAFDVALMSRELMKNKNITPYISTWIDHIRDGQTQIVNTNKLIKTYSGVTGIKTGTSEKAGSCISASAEKNGIKLIAVVLGCNNPQDRFKEVTKILDYGFSEYILITPQLPPDMPSHVKIKNGLQEEVLITADVTIPFIIQKETAQNIACKININEEISAPVNAGDKIGEVVYTIGDEVLNSYDIKINSDVGNINFEAVIKILILNFFTL